MAMQHLVIRVNPTLRLRDQQINVVEAHNAAFAAHRAVGLAKFGRAPADNRVEKLRVQLREGMTTYLYLVARTGNEYVAFRASIQSIPKKGDTPPESLIPSLYHDTEGVPGFWVVIGEPLKKAPIDSLVLSRGARPLLDVLSECRTSLMFVTDGTEKAKRASHV